MTKLYSFLAAFLVGSFAYAQDYTDGIFVLNEGGSGAVGASVSFIKNNAVTNDIYATANPNNTLGTIGQSIGFNGDYAYIVLNMSKK